jgi:hypothetical protein
MIAVFYEKSRVYQLIDDLSSMISEKKRKEITISIMFNSHFRTMKQESHSLPTPILIKFQIGGENF